MPAPASSPSSRLRPRTECTNRSWRGCDPCGELECDRAPGGAGEGRRLERRPRISGGLGHVGSDIRGGGCSGGRPRRGRLLQHEETRSLASSAELLAAFDEFSKKHAAARERLAVAPDETMFMRSPQNVSAARDVRARREPLRDGRAPKRQPPRRPPGIARPIASSRAEAPSARGSGLDHPAGLGRSLRARARRALNGTQLGSSHVARAPVDGP